MESEDERSREKMREEERKRESERQKKRDEAREGISSKDIVLLKSVLGGAFKKDFFKYFFLK